MAAPKLRTPADATINAPPVSALAARLAADPFFENCRARHEAFLRREAERAVAIAELGPSPAFAAAEAAFADHARCWVQARRDALAGTDLTPVRDPSPGLREFAPTGRRFIHV